MEMGCIRRGNVGTCVRWISIINVQMNELVLGAYTFFDVTCFFSTFNEQTSLMTSSLENSDTLLKKLFFGLYSLKDCLVLKRESVMGLDLRLRRNFF